jgi:hypothetical protein
MKKNIAFLYFMCLFFKLNVLGQFTDLKKIDTILFSNLHTFFFDEKEHEFWIATSTNIYIYDGINITDTIPTNNKNIHKIIKDKSERIWVVFDVPHVEIVIYEDKKPIDSISQMAGFAKNADIQKDPIEGYILVSDRQKIGYITNGEKPDFAFNADPIKVFGKKNTYFFYEVYDCGEQKHISFQKYDDTLIIADHDNIYGSFKLDKTGKKHTIAAFNNSMFKDSNFRYVPRFLLNGAILIYSENLINKTANIYYYNKQNGWRLLKSIKNTDGEQVFYNSGVLSFNFFFNIYDYKTNQNLLFECDDKGCDSFLLSQTGLIKAAHYYKDNYGQFWLLNLNGFFKFNHNVCSYNSNIGRDEVKPWAIVEHKNTGDMFLGSYGGEFKMLRKDSLYMSSIHQTDKRLVITMPAPVFYQNKVLMLPENTEEGCIYEINHNRALRKILVPQPNAKAIWGAAYLLYISPQDSSLAVGTAEGGLWVYRPRNDANLDNAQNWTNIVPESRCLLGNVLGVAHDKYGRWWGGRPSAGFFCYAEATDTITRFLRTNNQNKFGVISFQLDAKGNLWLGTTQGLYFYDINKYGNTTPKIEQFQSVASNYFEGQVISSLACYGDSILLINDNKGGLACLDLNRYYSKKEEPIIYFAEIGVSSQNGFFIDSKGFIWLKGEKINIQKLLNIPRDSVGINIQKILALGNSFMPDSANHIFLPYDARSTSFVMDYKSTHLSSNYYFQVIITKAQGDTVLNTTIKNTTRFDYIFQDYGNYHVEIQVKQRNKILARYKATIYLEQNWTEFMANLAIVFIVLLLSLSVLYLNSRRKMQKMQKDYLADEKAMLTNNINTHFITNLFQVFISLVILRKRNLALLTAKLAADNLRNVFSINSNQLLAHSLETELKMVSNFLDIQKIMISNRFAYYQMPDEVTMQRLKDIKVPPQCVYIHAENAADHGLRSYPTVPYNGYIKIDVSDDEDYLYITISDNGVGREYAKQKGLKNSGKGIALQKRIFARHNRNNKNKLNSDYLPSEIGTVAKIIIPKITIYK